MTYNLMTFGDPDFSLHTCIADDLKTEPSM